MEDILKSLVDAGFTPEVVEDTSDFSPITGKYVCRIDSAGRVSGKSERTGNEYDFYSVSIQVAEIIDGDKATNRFLKLNYNKDADGIKKLLNDLFTADIKLGVSSDKELEEALPLLKDKTMNIRAWVWTPTKDKAGNEIPEENRKAYQQLRVVKSFKGKAKSEAVKSSVPF
jgi:hypothetical protein